MARPVQGQHMTSEKCFLQLPSGFFIDMDKVYMLGWVTEKYNPDTGLVHREGSSTRRVMKVWFIGMRDPIRFYEEDGGIIDAYLDQYRDR